MKEEVMSKYAELKATIESKFYDEAFADGVASVGGEVVAPVMDQAAMDAYAAQKVAEAIAALPADVTPFAQGDIDKAVAESSDSLMGQISDLKIKLSQKDADGLEEAVAAELMALAAKLSARTVPAPVVEVPVEVAPEAPVEAAPVEAAPSEEVQP